MDVSPSSSPSAAESTLGTWHTTWPSVDHDRGSSSRCRKEGGRETKERGGERSKAINFCFFCAINLHKRTLFLPIYMHSFNLNVSP